MQLSVSPNKLIIEAESESDAELLARFAQMLMAETFRSPHHSSSSSFISNPPYGSSSSYARPVSASLGIKQVDLAAKLMQIMEVPITPRELHEAMLRVPGYTTRSKNHLDLIRHLLRSHENIFYKDPFSGRWGLTKQGIELAMRTEIPDPQT